MYPVWPGNEGAQLYITIFLLQMSLAIFIMVFIIPIITR